MRILVVFHARVEARAAEARLRLAFPGAAIDVCTDPLLAMKASVSGPIDLTVCGCVLKVMNGLALIGRLRERNPGMAALLTGEAALRDEAARAGVLLLEEPWTEADLDAAIARLDCRRGEDR